MLEREVRANIVYRHFTRIGWETVPDAKTLARIASALGPEVIERLHERLIEMARQERVVSGRKMRIDTTVVETNVHYPTDSSLLADGLRVLTRTMRRIEQAAGGAGERLRDRLRSVAKIVMRIGRSTRSQQGAEQRRELYAKLLEIGGRVVAQARRFVNEIQQGVKSTTELLGESLLQGLSQQIDEMAGRVEQVRRQTKQRVFEGETQAEDKLLSVFEPATEVIRKGKAGKPNEFGEMLQVQEAENQIITAYAVYEKRPDDREILIEAVEEHERRLGRTPRLVAAGAGFSSGGQRAGAGDDGSRAGIDSQLHDEGSGAARQTEAKMVQAGAKVAHRSGRENQRTEAPPWTKPQPLPGPGRHAALGGAGGDRRQPDQHRDQARGQGVKLIGRAAGSALRGSNFRRFLQWESSEKAFLRRKVARNPADKHYVVRFRGT